MCNTAHHSWEAFSKHFLQSHGSMPKILLKYKCVPCNVSLPSRSEYLKHGMEKHNNNNKKQPETVARNGKEGGGAGGEEGLGPRGAMAAPVRLVFAAPASYLRHKKEESKGVAALPPSTSASGSNLIMPNRQQVSCTATLQLQKPQPQQPQAFLRPQQLPNVSPTPAIVSRSERQKQQPKQQQQQHGRGACKYCDQCKMSFKSGKSYKRHLDQRHSTSGPKHACQFCSRVFRRSDNLNAHCRTVHLGVRPNRCGRCGKGYRSKVELQRHEEEQRCGAPAKVETSTLFGGVQATTATATATTTTPLPPPPTAAQSSLPPPEFPSIEGVGPTSLKEDEVKMEVDSLLDDDMDLPSLHFDSDILGLDSLIPNF